VEGGGGKQGGSRMFWGQILQILRWKRVDKQLNSQKTQKGFGGAAARQGPMQNVGPAVPYSICSTTRFRVSLPHPG